MLLIWVLPVFKILRPVYNVLSMVDLVAFQSFVRLNGPGVLIMIRRLNALNKACMACESNDHNILNKTCPKRELELALNKIMAITNLTSKEVGNKYFSNCNRWHDENLTSLVNSSTVSSKNYKEDVNKILAEIYIYNTVGKRKSILSKAAPDPLPRASETFRSIMLHPVLMQLWDFPDGEKNGILTKDFNTRHCSRSFLCQWRQDPCKYHRS